jgi:hypothetical protein
MNPGDDRTDASGSTEDLPQVGPDGWEDRWLPAVPVSDTDAWPVFDLEFTVETTPSGLVQCTIFPRDVDEDDLLTRWITADRGSFLSLGDAR